MSMKINVGLSRKIGQPHFGSLGASCHIDLELDAQTLHEQPQWVEAKIREAFSLCRESIDSELAQSDQSDLQSLRLVPPLAGPSPWQQQEQSTASSRSSGHSGSGPRPATPAQVKAIRSIAGKIGVSLASELSRRFGVTEPQQLSLRQASEMIDSLKASLMPTGA